MFPTGSLVLFQGDSVTDGGRSRNEDLNHVLGHGYAYLIAARLSAHMPEQKLRFFNRGISGNRVVDLYARWKEDAINLSPDVLSILVGVNDVGAGFSRNAGVPVDRYEKVYSLMLEETVAALPRIRLVVCEPFILPVGPVGARWDEWKREIDLRRAAAERIARRFEAVFVRTQTVFEDACGRAPAECWLWDGVHPMPAGHELIARAWLEAVSRRK